jgi:alpha-aminoadipic semialdehyde synthase
MEGSIQFLKKYTSPEAPIYFYNPLEQSISDVYIPKTT